MSISSACQCLIFNTDFHCLTFVILWKTIWKRLLKYKGRNLDSLSIPSQTATEAMNRYHRYRPSGLRICELEFDCSTCSRNGRRLAMRLCRKYLPIVSNSWTIWTELVAAIALLNWIFNFNHYGISCEYCFGKLFTYPYRLAGWIDIVCTLKGFVY